MSKSIKVFLELDTSRFDRNLTKSSRQIDSVDDSVKSAGSSLTSYARAAAGAFSVVAIGNFLSQVQNLQNQLKLVTTDQNNLNRTFDTLLTVANRSRVAIGGTVELYQKLALSTKDLNVDQGTLIRTTETFSKLLSIAGTSAQGADGAIRQLGQGLASGALRGDEFNSVVEAAPGILDILADATGRTRGEIRELAADGAITADLLIQALSGAAQDVDQQYSRTTATIGQALTILQNNFVDLGRQATPVADAIAQAILLLADNLEIAAVAVGAFVAAFAVNQLASAASALGALRTAVLAVNTAILANPIGAVLAAIAAAAVLIVTYWDDIQDAATNAYLQIELSYQRLKLFLMNSFGGALNSVVDGFLNIRDTAVATWTAIKAAAENPLDAVDSFNKAFDDTIESLQQGRKDNDRFADAVEETTSRIKALETALARNATGEVEDFNDAIDDTTPPTRSAANEIKNAAAQLRILNNRTRDATVEVKKVNNAYDDFIEALEQDVRLSGLTSRQREIAIAQLRAQEAAAKELGITTDDLAQETVDAINEEVRLLIERRNVATEAAEAMIQAEEAKQQALDETLRAMERNSQELIAGSQRAVERLQEEHEFMRTTIGLYGTQRDVAEQLFEYDRQAKDEIRQLEIDYQRVLADTSATEAQKQAAKERLDQAMAAYQTNRAMVEEEARRNSEYQRSFTYGWREAYAEFSDNATNSARQAGEMFNTFATGISDALYDFAMTGKLSFKDLLDSMKSTIARFLADRATQKFLEFLDTAIFGAPPAGGGAPTTAPTAPAPSSGSSGGGFGGVVGNVVSSVIDAGKDLIGGIFGFADGGYIPGNKPAIVGERGAELFMPAGSGTIIPNFAGGGMNGVTNVTYNISAVDARSFKQLVASDPEFIYNVTLAGSRRVPQ